MCVCPFTKKNFTFQEIQLHVFVLLLKNYIRKILGLLTLHILRNLIISVCPFTKKITLKKNMLRISNFAHFKKLNYM